MVRIPARLGGIAADVTERAAVSLLAGISSVCQARTARTVAGGYNLLLAHSPLGPAVGRTIYHLGSAAHPNHLLTTRADRRLRTLIGGRTAQPQESLGEWEMLEFGSRHVGLAAATMMLWVIPFIYGTNPSRFRFSVKELAVLVRRFRDLLTKDMRNIGKVFPREIACLTHLDLDPQLTSKAFAETHAAMFAAAQRGSTVAAASSPVSPYLVQRFHWRDWSDRASAQSWDLQVDTLFAGLYGAMERSVIPDLLEALALGSGRPQRVLEVAGGTGSFLNSSLKTLKWRGHLPGVTFDFVEPSAMNMALAKERLRPWGDCVRFLDFRTTGACAERLPIPDGSVDVLIAQNLFHELPPRARQQAAREFARVLRRPNGSTEGGRLLFLDSAQLGDGIDGVLKAFGGHGRGSLPRGTFHEPFYGSYLGEDLCSLFAREGLLPVGDVEYAYVAKKWTFNSVYRSSLG